MQGVLPEELLVKPPSYFQAQVAQDKYLPPSVCPTRSTVCVRVRMYR